MSTCSNIHVHIYNVIAAEALNREDVVVEGDGTTIWIHTSSDNASERHVLTCLEHVKSNSTNKVCQVNMIPGSDTIHVLVKLLHVSTRGEVTCIYKGGGGWLSFSRGIYRAM